jgi:imidazoleglycerol-phosphate dehydratase
VRKARLHRATAETEIRIALTIEGRGKYDIATGIHFLDHMLELFARHGGFDLKLKAAGDLEVDQHHTVEDVGIALGEVFDLALGNRRGILRAGYFVMPMDETLGLAAVDFGGRAAAVVDTKVRAARVGDLQVELVCDFFEGFARGARATTRSKRSSKHSPEPCAWHAPAIVAWAECCRAPRGFYDRHRGLWRGQPEFCEKGV